jgi:hypothetical protein
MQKVWSLLERYSGAFPGVVFKITEFDVDTEDESLQADYTRDLLTLVFSHPQAAGFRSGASGRDRTGGRGRRCTGATGPRSPTARSGAS